jgi:hypothetical protein
MKRPTSQGKAEVAAGKLRIGDGDGRWRAVARFRT